MFTGIAKPMPILPPLRETITELMPTSSPLRLTSAPSGIARIDRRVGLNEVFEALGVDAAAARGALTIPDVTVFEKPNGLPIATT